MKKRMKKIGHIAYIGIVIVLFAIAGLAAATVVKVPGNYKLLVVQSGSMEPSVHTGSVVVVQKANTYTINEVITFRNQAISSDPTTHRIVETAEVNGVKTYVTKGDANKSPDEKPINENQVIGRMLFSVPFVGYIVDFAKTRAGFIVLIIVPAVAIIYNELMSIKKETVRLLRKRHYV